MGAKAKKVVMKKLKKSSSQKSTTGVKDGSADFLPLEGGPGRKLPKSETLENKATVLYIGRIPHGFYEHEVEGFFKQFGTIMRLRLAKNKKTGKSKHFGFIEFESPEVAKIVSECMHNYLMFEHMLQVHLIPPEHVHPKLWEATSLLRRRLGSRKTKSIREDEKYVVFLYSMFPIRSCCFAYKSIRILIFFPFPFQVYDDEHGIGNKCTSNCVRFRSFVFALVMQEFDGFFGCRAPVRS
ncbi:hypothetical protein ACSBR2_027401 [Camellia fascicularis]